MAGKFKYVKKILNFYGKGQHKYVYKMSGKIRVGGKRKIRAAIKGSRPQVPLRREKSYLDPKVYSTYDTVFKKKANIAIVKRLNIHDPQLPLIRRSYDYITYERDPITKMWEIQKGVQTTKTKALSNFNKF